MEESKDVRSRAATPFDPDLLQRLRDSYGPIYLSILSLILAVTLADFAMVVADAYREFTPVNWLLVAMSFCSLIVTWNVYTLQSVLWSWIPDLRDAALPFVVGANASRRPSPPRMR